MPENWPRYGIEIPSRDLNISCLLLSRNIWPCILGAIFGAHTTLSSLGDTSILRSCWPPFYRSIIDNLDRIGAPWWHFFLAWTKFVLSLQENVINIQFGKVCSMFNLGILCPDLGVRCFCLQTAWRLIYRATKLNKSLLLPASYTTTLHILLDKYPYVF